MTLYEAFNFIDRLKEAMAENPDLTDITLIQSPDAETKFKAHGKKVSKFIGEWNKDPNNRDKTYLVFKDLVVLKDEMLKNLDLLNDRDLLLDLANEKTQRLEKQAKILRQNARKTKRHFIKRRMCLWIVGIVIIALIVVAIVLILKLGFNVI